jgi:3-oxoacyl-[acyl-carrier-protein] synthase II
VLVNLIIITFRYPSNSVIGHRAFWKRLIAAEAGITALPKDKYHDIPSRVAGQIPLGSKNNGAWDPNEWLDSHEQRKMALFAQYAVAAAQEAIEDANIQNLSSEERETVVCLM